MINEMKIMQLIAQGGDARSYAMKGIALARKNHLVEAKASINAGKESVTQAHHIQTELIQKEAGGEKQEITLLMIHAQDHLMNAMTIIDLAEEFIYLYEERSVNK